MEAWAEPGKNRASQVKAGLGNKRRSQVLSGGLKACLIILLVQLLRFRISKDVWEGVKYKNTENQAS